MKKHTVTKFTRKKNVKCKVTTVARDKFGFLCRSCLETDYETQAKIQYKFKTQNLDISFHLLFYRQKAKKYNKNYYACEWPLYCSLNL